MQGQSGFINKVLVTGLPLYYADSSILSSAERVALAN